MLMDQVFTHNHYYSDDSSPTLYWQGGSNSIYFAKGNVFDYEYYDFDGVVVQFRPALSNLNGECLFLIREHDADIFPEIPILIIGFNVCMLLINPNKDLELKTLIDRYPEVIRESGRKGSLRRYIIGGQNTDRDLRDKPFAPSSRLQISILVNELLSTMDRQGCKRIGFHGIYDRDYHDCEHYTVQSVRDWCQRCPYKGMRVTMVDARDSYNRRL